jgi:hypothetical protein
MVPYIVKIQEPACIEPIRDEHPGENSENMSYTGKDVYLPLRLALGFWRVGASKQRTSTQRRARAERGAVVVWQACPARTCS